MKPRNDPAVGWFVSRLLARCSFLFPGSDEGVDEVLDVEKIPDALVVLLDAHDAARLELAVAGEEPEAEPRVREGHEGAAVGPGAEPSAVATAPQ